MTNQRGPTYIASCRGCTYFDEQSTIEPSGDGETTEVYWTRTCTLKKERIPVGDSTPDWCPIPAQIKYPLAIEE